MVHSRTEIYMSEKYTLEEIKAKNNIGWDELYKHLDIKYKSL